MSEVIGPVRPFDPFDELPDGLLSVEASAGTGKTYALAGLATRYLAEGRVTASELLMVTFTRAATGELRARVRDRVAAAAAHLAAHLSAGEADADDAFLSWLASPEAPGGTLQQRLLRLEVALSEFDAATITTIHGFAAQLLGALGVGSGTSGDLRFVEDTDERLVEACSDILVAAAVDPTITANLPTWTTFTARVKSVLGSPDVVITPVDGDTESPADAVVLASLVRRAVEVMRTRRRDSGTQSFDDLLVRLGEALSAQGTGAAATAVLRRRFGVVLIDEFQDTDPVQWQVFRTLFAAGAEGVSSANGVDDRTSLVLVGDPKQAIYSFRGADVSTYISAVETTRGIDKRTLETNWRSDAPVLDATAALFEGVTFGDPITYSRVAVAEGHERQRLRRVDLGDEPVTGLEIRCLTSPQLQNDKGLIVAANARSAAIADLVSRTIELLDTCVLPDDAPNAPAGSTRPLEPRDVAVLVRSNNSAQQVQSALLARGVPAVLARGASVVESPAAEQLTWLLEAMVRPSDQRRARTFAASWFGGRSPLWLASASEIDIGLLQEQRVSWSAALNTQGVVEFLRTVWEESAVVQRLLVEPDGDRSVTDLEHLGELLRLSVGDGAVSAAGLLGSLGGLRKGVDVQVDTDRDTDVTSRRVESDAQAVQIMTVWVAKGLEFPVVLCPNMWVGSSGEIDYHDPATGQRVFDVRAPSKAGKAMKTQVQLAAREQSAEEMRLLYVALTRARHHTTVWWVNSSSAPKSALAKVLFARSDDGSISDQLFERSTLKDDLPAHDATLEKLRHFVDISGGGITVRDAGDPRDDVARWVDPSEGIVKPPLAAARLSRRAETSLRRDRSRWSFSAMVSRDRTEGDPWDVTIDDEGADDEQRPPDVGLGHDLSIGDPDLAGTTPVPSLSEAAVGPADSPTSPLAWLPAGAAFGTLAHDVLETVDFAADDLESEVGDSVERQRGWRSLSLRPVGDERPPGDPDAERAGSDLLVDGLTRVIRTPLGPLFSTESASGTRLADIPQADRLDEMTFELNLGSTDLEGSARPAPTDRDIARLLLEHLEPCDPFRPWAAHLADGVFRVDLQGHLTGSIDAVVRLPGAPSESPTDRFMVVDYKTNRLHDHGVAPRPGDYGAAAMQRSMMEHHYLLQALLYSVAVHRYLRWRLAGYDPEVNLGGIAYLFLRGMTGPDVATLDGTAIDAGGSPEGVCTWVPPSGLIQELSDLLDARHPLASTSGSRQ
ncbi:MAG: UvrD-helicase domain-containing protein [Microthrixaceae bacterium]